MENLILLEHLDRLSAKAETYYPPIREATTSWK
jgi:hypothetical protein